MRQAKSVGPLALAFIGLALVGCSTNRIGANRFMIDKRWVRTTLEKEHLGSSRQHRFRPILSGDLVIQGNAIDGVSAYDRNTARRLWRTPIKDGTEGGGVIAGDKLIVPGSDGQIYGLALSTGRIVWSYPLRSEGLSEPAHFQGVIYVLAGNNVLHALDAETGKMLWIYTRRDATSLSIRGGSRPTIDRDLVLLGFSDGYVVALRRESGVLVWETTINRNRRFKDVDAAVVVQGDRIYVGGYDSSLYCLNRADGRVQWTVDEGAYSEVSLQGDVLYYSTSTGAVLAVDRLSGKVLWRKQLSGDLATTPTLTSNYVVVGEFNGALKFLNKTTGEEVGQFEPGWGVTSQVVVDEPKGEAFFMSAGGNLFALKFGWRRLSQLWPWETP